MLTALRHVLCIDIRSQFQMSYFVPDSSISLKTNLMAESQNRRHYLHNIAASLSSSLSLSLSLSLYLSIYLSLFLLSQFFSY